MKFSTPLLVLASATTALAGCYSGGANWQNEQNKVSARGAVEDLCNQGALSGWFDRGGATKSACANLNGVRANFQVVWNGSGGATLAVSDCKLRLNNEINGCWQGGESTTAQWFFR
jgi:hypothetical protein